MGIKLKGLAKCNTKKKDNEDEMMMLDLPMLIDEYIEYLDVIDFNF